MFYAVVDNWQSILLYLAVFAFSAIAIYIGTSGRLRWQYQNRILIFIGLLMPIIMAGVRYRVGRDYGNYVGMVEKIQHGEAMWPHPIEPLSSAFIHASVALGGSVTMFFLFAILTIVLAFLAIRKIAPKHAGYTALAYFMYLCIIFPTTFNTMRSGLAISIVLFACTFLVNSRQRYQQAYFVIGIGIAALFHVSALIMLPVGLAVSLSMRAKARKRAKIDAALLALATIAALFLPLIGKVVAVVPIPIISRSVRIFDGIDSHFSIPIIVWVMVASMLAVFLATKDSAKEDSKLRLVRTFSIYYIPMAIALGWLSDYSSTSRMAFYIDAFIIVLIVYALKEYADRELKRKMGVYFAAMCIVFFCSVILVRNLYWAYAIPYSTVLLREAKNGHKN